MLKSTPGHNAEPPLRVCCSSEAILGWPGMLFHYSPFRP
jgi:hypothetical protein